MPYKACAAALLVSLTLTARAAEVLDGWTVVTKDGNLTTYSRAHKGSPLLEYRGVTVLDAPTVTIKRVIDDTSEYPKFMPYVVETKTLFDDGANRIGYQRLSPPFVGDRDYTVRVKCESKACPITGGTIFCNRWQTANDLGPAEKKGVTRVKVTEGSWLLEPTKDGRTRATYTIFSDSGGGIPAMLLNKANKTVIPKLFDAIRKQAKLAKYGQGKP